MSEALFFYTRTLACHGESDVGVIHSQKIPSADLTLTTLGVITSVKQNIFPAPTLPLCSVREYGLHPGLLTVHKHISDGRGLLLMDYTCHLEMLPYLLVADLLFLFVLIRS